MPFLSSVYSFNPLSGRKELYLTPHFLELRYGKQEQAKWNALVESDTRLSEPKDENYTQAYLRTQKRVDDIVEKMSVHAQREGRPTHYEATLIDRSVISFDNSLTDGLAKRTLRTLKSYEIIRDLCTAPGGKLAVLLPFVRSIDTFDLSNCENIGKEDVLAAVVASGIGKSILGQRLKRKNLENVCNLGQKIFFFFLEATAGFAIANFFTGRDSFRHIGKLFFGSLLSYLSFLTLPKAVDLIRLDQAYRFPSESSYATQTNEADECAIRLMHRSGYEIKGFPIMLMILTNEVSPPLVLSLANRFIRSQDIIERIEEEDTLRLAQIVDQPELKG